MCAQDKQVLNAGQFIGSSRITGERGADFEEEVFLVAVSVSSTFDDLDGVVDALDDAGIQRRVAQRNDLCQLSIRIRSTCEH